MSYLRSELGFINELGMFFIPKIMQQESKIKACKDGLVTLVTSEVEDGHIVLKHYKTISMEEHAEMRKDKDKPKNIQTIDDLGWVALRNAHQKMLDIWHKDVMASYLLDDETIKIRPLIMDCVQKLQLFTSADTYIMGASAKESTVEGIQLNYQFMVTEKNNSFRLGQNEYKAVMA